MLEKADAVCLCGSVELSWDFVLVWNISWGEKASFILNGNAGKMEILEENKSTWEWLQLSV